jgi:hypothetical protein
MMLIPYSRSLTPAPESSDPEIAELKWSLGVVGGRVVVNKSGWNRFKRLFRKRSIEENLGIAGADAAIQVRALDDATIDIQLHVVNFSGKEILVEHVGADWFGVSSGFVATSGPTLLPSTATVKPRSIGGLTLRFHVLPNGIRDLARLVRQGHTRRSSPDARLHIRGTMMASQGSARAPVKFEVHVPTPQIEWASNLALPD